MAALIPKDGTLLNYADQAPSPQKDYCQILVKKDKVCFISSELAASLCKYIVNGSDRKGLRA